MTSIPFARTLLPDRLYERLAASDIARRLAHGSLWTLFGSAVSRLLLLVAMILLARLLGRTQFGEFGIIQTTLGVGGLMAGIGLGDTAARFVAQYSKTDPARAGRVIALVTGSSIATVLVASIVLAAASGTIARAVLDAPHLQDDLIWGLVLMAATALRGVQNGVLGGLEKFDAIARLNIIDAAVSLAAMLPLALTMGAGGALIGMALGAVAAFVVGCLVLTQVLQDRGIRVRYGGCLAEWPMLTGYSMPSFLASLVGTPALWLAMAIVAHSEHGYSSLGLYNAAYQWHGPMIFLPLILAGVSVPLLVEEWSAGRRPRFRRLALGMCGLLLAIAIPPAAVLSLLSPWIMGVYGPEFRDGWPLLVLLLAAAPLHGVSRIGMAALGAMNHAWWVLALNAGWGAALLSIALWLVPTMGAAGLAVAFLAAHALFALASVGLILVGSRPVAEPDGISSAIA